jgi:ribosomal protein L18E
MKHLADHDHKPSAARVKNYLRIARDHSENLWRGLWQRPLARSEGNRRVVEFVRIARGREV